MSDSEKPSVTGNYKDAFNNKFTYVLSLVSDPEIMDCIKKGNLGKFGRDICYVEDGDSLTFWAAIDKYTETVMYQLKRGFVLINCEAGMSRSTAFAVNILVGCGFSISAAEDMVRKSNPSYAASDKFIKVIKEYYRLEELEKNWNV